jgi:copper chaperone CopZ
MQNTLNLSLSGMHCGACVRRVTAALEALPGVQVRSVEVGSARISFDPAQTEASRIVAAIDRIGFRASVEPMEPR